MKAYKTKALIVLLIFTLTSVNQLFGQVPYINNVDITSGTFGETVTITGSNFSNNSADLIVKFGGVDAIISSSTTSIIEALVPAGVTYDNITVTNTSGSSVKTGYSNELFNISFGGNKGSTAAFDALELINETSTDISTYDLCMCDFDRDGLLDIAVSNNGSNNIVIHKNNSTPNATSFAKFTETTGFSTINITCGDIDGDGYADLVATQGGTSNENIFVFRNAGNGNIDFGTHTTIAIPRNGSNLRFVRRVAIQDLDLDGKPEIIVTNTSDNLVDVFKNNSTQGSISISTSALQFEMVSSDSRDAGLSGLDVKDLNNDGFPEIVASYNRQSNVYILPNSSEPGAISFENSKEIDANGGFQNLKVGDINQDGFNDIVLTGSIAGTPANTIVIVRNDTSTPGGDITMSSAATITDITAPWGLDIGDIDGNGSVDIAVASVGSPAKVFVITADDPSALTFSSTSISTTENNRNIKIGDLNGDGKPDLALTHNVTDGQQGELAVLMNRNCLIPIISPSDINDVCTGQEFKLSINNSPSAAFDWKRNGGSVGTSYELIVDTMNGPRSDNYTVTVSDVGCTQTSDAHALEVSNAAIAAPNATSSAGSAVICAGTEVTFMTGQTFAGYEWTGPDGFTSTEQNPVISSVTQDMTGKYFVFGKDADGCISQTSEVVVVVENLPSINVNNDNEDIFCTGSTADISVTDFGSDFSYKWKKDGSDIAGQTSTSLTVSESGDYSAVIISIANSCELESPVRTITTVPVPTNAITTDPADGVICEDLAINFSTPAGDQNNQPVTHLWDYGDGSSTEEGASVSHAFADASTPTVKLTTSYTNLSNCPSTETTKVVTVQGVPNTPSGPTIDISSDLSDPTTKCPSDVFALSVDDLYTNYSWFVTAGTVLSTTSSLPELTDPERGDDPVTYILNATDDAGCVFSDSIKISLKSASGITLNSMDAVFNDATGENEIELDEDQLSVDLSVANATGITWTPEEIFDNPTADMVTAVPNDINILVKVFGTDASGCLESDSVRIINPIIRAKSVFSPNGDGIGDECWEITNARTQLSGCTIFIFDSKGQIIKQEAINNTVDDCIWDGTHNGLALPEGIYYYALKCTDNSISITNPSGSILLGR
ncbi:MAG: VCBS repeat-containing protein [Cyclobacteriaceae bacterium]